MADSFAVDAEKLKRLQAVIDRYKGLDDAVLLLQTDLARLKRLIDQYGGDLRTVLADFLDANKMWGISQDAQEQFFKSMQRFIENGQLDYRRASSEKLLESIQSTWGSQVNRAVSTVTDSLFQRAAGFKSMAEAAIIPVQRLADIQAYEITSVVIGDKQYNYPQLQSVWKQMNDSYGQRDTIQFRNGVNFPLRSYVDARAITSSTEAHRLTTIFEASSNGVYFGTVNKTGSTDSCLLHENEIFFLNEGAKAEALAKWPNVEALLNMKTWQEIKDDATHMGKFGCKHILRASSVQFFSEQRMVDTLKEKTGLPVPEKINERAIFEKATGRQWQSAQPKERQTAYQPIPNRREIQPRYTIA